MFLIGLFRHLRGFVRFTASGVFLERFLNLLARERIALWDVKRREQTLTGCVSASAYSGLRPLAKKAGVRLHILEKKGLPFKKKKLKKRRGLLAGLCVFILFIAVMTRFIWSIQVEGNEQIPEEAILHALEELGVKPGVLRTRIDVRESEKRMLLSVKELSWIALNIDGSTIHVVVNEAAPIPPMVDPHKPCNVVASHSGQLLELRVYAGQPMLQKGAAVLEGEVIVSGVTLDKTGKSLLRHARADILAEVAQEVEVRVPLHQTTYEKTGKTARRDYLRVFGFEAPLFLPWRIQGPYLISRDENPLQIFSTQLPVAHRSEVFTLMEEVPLIYTEEQAKAMAFVELAAAEKAKLGDAEIIERVLTGGLEGEEFVLRAAYVAHMNIALEKEIYTADFPAPIEDDSQTHAEPDS